MIKEIAIILLLLIPSLSFGELLPTCERQLPEAPVRSLREYGYQQAMECYREGRNKEKAFSKAVLQESTFYQGAYKSLATQIKDLSRHNSQLSSILLQAKKKIRRMKKRLRSLRRR